MNSFRVLSLFVAVLSSLTCASAVTVIDSIGTLPAAGTNQANPSFMTSITAGATTYLSLTPGASVTPEAGDSARIWGQGGLATDPGTVSIALTDLDITTGALNIGNDSLYFLGETVTSSTMLFLTANFGTDNPGVLIAIDSLGNDISQSLTFPASSTDVASVAVRTQSGTTLDRTIRGWVFGVNEFTLNGGVSLADFAGFRVNSSNFDPQDFGIAAVPEPSAAVLLGLGAVVAAWRRRATR